MKKLNRAIIILSKIIEVGCFIACGMLAAMIVFSTMGKINALSYLSDVNESVTSLEAYGFSLSVRDSTGAAIPGAYVLFFVNMFLCSGLMAMVFRNIYLIFKTTEGKTNFSKGETPFQPDNVRMVREIGIFCMAIPVVELIISVIARIILTVDMVESSVGFEQFLIGMVVLALSQFFVYGMQLQEEVDGLV